MHIIIIAVIAAGILVYFSFFTGKSGDTSQPVLIREALDDDTAEATVKFKTVENVSTVRRKDHLRYFAVFALDDGSEIEFSVPRKIYDELNIGDRDTLVYHGDVFVGFGDIGAAGDDSGDAAEAVDDSFTLDDYDETIDVEISPDAEYGADGSDTGMGDPGDYELFIERETLPVKSETVTDETGAYADYRADILFEKTTVYPFLKREINVREMFVKTYAAAVTDLLGYDGDSRVGKAADSIILNKNEIRVVITIKERPLPLLASVEAEFGINE